MKKRTLFTNIFIVILMVAIVFVLLAFFDIFKEDTLKQPILSISMSVALVSVALIDIVFPLIDNFKRFKQETGYKIKSAVKIVLFAVSVVFLILTVKGIGIFEKQFLGIALFCLTYLAQFFIDLDREKKVQIEDYDASQDETGNVPNAFEQEADEDDSFWFSWDIVKDNLQHSRMKLF